MTHNPAIDETAIDVEAFFAHHGVQLTDNSAPDDVADFLAHYGVKGMRWGVRRNSSGGSEPSEDAQRASAHRSKAKSSGTAALSNKEMQELVTRLNLQQQYSRLTSSPSKLALSQNKVKAILAVGATVNTAIAFANTPAGKMLKEIMADGGGKHSVGVPVGVKTAVSTGPGKHRK